MSCPIPHNQLQLTNLHGTIWQYVETSADRIALVVTSEDLGKDVQENASGDVFKLVGIDTSGSGVWALLTGGESATGVGWQWVLSNTPTSGQFGTNFTTSAGTTSIIMNTTSPAGLDIGAALGAVPVGSILEFKSGDGAKVSYYQVEGKNTTVPGQVAFDVLYLNSSADWGGVYDIGLQDFNDRDTQGVANYLLTSTSGGNPGTGDFTVNGGTGSDVTEIRFAAVDDDLAIFGTTLLSLREGDQLLLRNNSNRSDYYSYEVQSVLFDTNQVVIQVTPFAGQLFPFLTDNVYSLGLLATAIGSTSFINLTDTPNSYTGFAGYTPVVNNAEDALVFAQGGFVPPGGQVLGYIWTDGVGGVNLSSGSFGIDSVAIVGTSIEATLTVPYPNTDYFVQLTPVSLSASVWPEITVQSTTTIQYQFIDDAGTVIDPATTAVASNLLSQSDAVAGLGEVVGEVWTAVGGELTKGIDVQSFPDNCDLLVRFNYGAATNTGLIGMSINANTTPGLWTAMSWQMDGTGTVQGLQDGANLPLVFLGYAPFPQSIGGEFVIPNYKSSPLNISMYGYANGIQGADDTTIRTSHFCGISTQVGVPVTEINFSFPDPGGLAAGSTISVHAIPQGSYAGAQQGGGAATAWGQITGTLSDQVDLQAALDLKVEGPATTADNALARFDTTTGKLLQSSSTFLDDLSLLVLEGNGAGVRVKERASAPSIAGQGLYWVKNLTPNEPWFTADDGTEYSLKPSASPGGGSPPLVTLATNETAQLDNTEVIAGGGSFDGSGLTTAAFNFTNRLIDGGGTPTGADAFLYDIGTGLVYSAPVLVATGSTASADFVTTSIPLSTDPTTPALGVIVAGERNYQVTTELVSAGGNIDVAQLLGCNLQGLT